MAAELMLGDEAVAWAAIDAGIAGAFSYPGTPSTEIFETIQAYADGSLEPSPPTPSPFSLCEKGEGASIWARWSANEKVAYEEALGMSYAGKRSLVSMKHVGLNVAADPFINSALTGVNGGLVLVVADDPGMHSSQNEQDSRFYAEFAKVPCLEPTTQQECYEMTRFAFEFSERIGLPVMLRLVTRLAHSRTAVHRSEDELWRRIEARPMPDPNDWTLVPQNARRRFARLLSMQEALARESEESTFNLFKLGGRRGLICTGPGWNYVREALDGELADSYLRVGQYPLPEARIRELVDHCDEVLVIEEGYPFIEQRLTGLLGLPSKTVHGKLDGTLPLQGELSPETVKAALEGKTAAHGLPDELVAPRPPQLCKGCPHADSFGSLVDATKDYPSAVLFSDIGCYTLGVMAPYHAVQSCVDMGASIGMAHGASRAGAYPVLCTIGDSTFSHSGLTPMIGAVRADADITILILDNATTAMTGTQESMATGEELMELLRGIGVKDLHLFEPLPKKLKENTELIRRAIEHRGLSVLVAKRACIHWKKPASIPVPQCQVAS